MPRSLVLAAVLAAIGPTAQAAPWATRNAATVELASAVEVPLYRGSVLDHRPAVLVEIPASEEDREPTQQLAVVDLCLGWSTLGSSLAKEWGLEVKETGDGKRAVVPELRIGELVLRDLRVEVTGDGLTLGVAALDLAGAILPSKRVVRFAPASEGADLVSSVGEPLATVAESGKKYWFHGSKQEGSGFLVAAPATLFGLEGQPAPRHQRDAIPHRPPRWPTRAESAARASPGWLSRPSSAESRSTRGGPCTTSPSSMRTVCSSARWATTCSGTSISPGTLRAASRSHPRPSPPGPTRRPSSSRSPARPTKPAPTKEDEDDGQDEAEDTSGGDPGDAAEVARETALAEALWDTGAIDEALEHYALATAAAGDQCAPPQLQGRRLLAAGKTDAAVAALRTAAERWERWDSQELETRERAAKDKAPEGAFTVSQPPGCHESWGDLALALLASGKHDEIPALFEAHTTLDGRVPYVAALSLLGTDNAAEANGPLRRAIDLGERQSAAVRLTLGVAQARTGDTGAARRQLDRLLASDAELSLDSAMTAVELGHLVDGDGGVAAAERLTTERPDSLAAAVAAGVAAQRTGTAPDAEALALLARRSTRRLAGDVDVVAQAAVVQALTGAQGAAREAIAAIAGPPTADRLVAAALIESLSGNAAGAQGLLDSAARQAPESPLATLKLLSLE